MEDEREEGEGIVCTTRKCGFMYDVGLTQNGFGPSDWETIRANSANNGELY